MRAWTHTYHGNAPSEHPETSEVTVIFDGPAEESRAGLALALRQALTTYFGGGEFAELQGTGSLMAEKVEIHADDAVRRVQLALCALESMGEDGAPGDDVAERVLALVDDRAALIRAIAALFAVVRDGWQFFSEDDIAEMIGGNEQTAQTIVKALTASARSEAERRHAHEAADR